MKDTMNLNTVLISVVGFLCTVMIAIAGFGLNLSIENSGQLKAINVQIKAMESTYARTESEVVALQERIRLVEMQQEKNRSNFGRP